jgi:hypothetical protein
MLPTGQTETGKFDRRVYPIVSLRRANQRTGFRAVLTRFVEPLGHWTLIGRSDPPTGSPRRQRTALTSFEDPRLQKEPQAS